MTEVARTTRTFRSRSPWYWGYLAVSGLALLVIMFIAADRLTQDGSSSRFEPIADSAEPENEFLPVDRPVSECISAIQKPGCGSEARGGWRQALVLLAILVGLALIVWRVVASARAAKSSQQAPVS